MLLGYCPKIFAGHAAGSTYDIANGPTTAARTGGGRARPAAMQCAREFRIAHDTGLNGAMQREG